MKKTILFLALFVTLAAHATETVKPPKNYIKTPQQLTANVSPTSASGSAAYANPVVTASPTVTAINGGNTAGGASVSTSTSVEGAQRSAPTVFVPAGSMPATSCRLFIGLGGSNTSGSLGGGVPIGNDAVCLAATQIALMDKLGGFSRADYLTAACRVEGMADTSVCKVQAERKAEGTGLAVVAGTSHTGEQ